MGAHCSPSARVPAGHCGIPTQVFRLTDQTWAGQQQFPAVSGPTLLPGSQTVEQFSPSSFVPVGHFVGTPTQVLREFDHTCPDQQQWPAVSTVITLPSEHLPGCACSTAGVSGAGGAPSKRISRRPVENGVVTQEMMPASGPVRVTELARAPLRHHLERRIDAQGSASTAASCRGSTGLVK